MAFFIGYLVIESLGFALELLVVHPAAPFKSLSLGLLMATSLLTAPCLWLAIRETVSGQRSRLSDLPFGHWVVIAVGALMTVPLMFSAHSGTEWVGPPESARAWHFDFIHHAMIGCMVIFAVQVPFYLWKSRRLLMAQRQGGEMVGLAQRAWLHLPLFIVGTTWIMGMARTVQCASQAPAGLNLLFALADVGMTVGAMFVIIQRASGGELLADAEAQPEINAAPVLPVINTEPKYAKSRLEDDRRERIRSKLKSALETEGQGEDSMISLSSLSRSLNEKPHYVSQVINQDLGTNFYELVNRHRITRAQQRLRAEPDRTVLEIALAVGFNSKSTFNTAFRRYTGTTPTRFRASDAGPS